MIARVFVVLWILVGLWCCGWIAAGGIELAHKAKPPAFDLATARPAVESSPRPQRGLQASQVVDTTGFVALMCVPLVFALAAVQYIAIGSASPRAAWRRAGR